MIINLKFKNTNINKVILALCFILLFLNLSCSSNHPSDSASNSKNCEKKCTVHLEKKCESSTVLACLDSNSNGCLSWEILKECVVPEVCMNGTCTDDPNENAHNCSNECADGEKKCNGNVIETCGFFDDDVCREWSKETECEEGFICKDAVCIESGDCRNQCDSQGLKQCTENTIEICGDYNSDGCLEWGGGQNCPSGTNCEDGQCNVPCVDECEIGMKICEENSYRTCGDVDFNGCSEWSELIQCADGELCVNGTCSSCNSNCTPLEKECDSDLNGYKICENNEQNNCNAWGEIIFCDNEETCSNGICSTNCTDECSEGEVKCDGNGARLCGNYDQDTCLEWDRIVQCADNAQCIEGECVIPCNDECSSGEKQCKGNAIENCGNYDTDTCLEWGEPDPAKCQSGEICDNAECICEPVTPFSDVHLNDLCFPYIYALYQLGIVTGYPDGTFKPNDEMTRADMAVILHRAFNLTTSDNISYFCDSGVVPYSVDAIEALYDNGITTGKTGSNCLVGDTCNGPHYCPLDPVSRAELAVFVFRIINNISECPDCPSSTHFCDSTSNWACGCIESIRNDGLVVGKNSNCIVEPTCSPGPRYCPNDNATRCEGAIVVSRAISAELPCTP